MKTKAICLIAIALLAGFTLTAHAAPDSLACRTIDWLDVTGTTMRYGSDGIDGDGDYEYSGTYLWDMAMGDSFLVWCPGTKTAYLIDPFVQSYVETLFSKESVTPFDFDACDIYLDSVIFFASGRDIKGYQFFPDSLSFVSHEYVHVPFASFFYAVIRDTLLYTASTDVYGLHCVNIANPESIFVAWSMDGYFGYNGLSIVDSLVYTSISTRFWIDPESDFHQRPHIQWLIAKISEDTSASMFDIEYMDNIHHGSLTSDGTNVFYVYSELSDFIWGVQDYTLGDSYLEVWGEDYSYTWSDYDSEGVFGVEVLNDTILAVGFEHGFSIIDYTQLAGMTEVAYYRDTDSIYCFTHFARKGNRMYALAHPREGICRMYMFELDSTIWTGISDPAPQTALPVAFSISAYPNPFNSAVTITLDIPVGDGSPVQISVEIYDVNGRRVAEIIPPDPPLTRGEEERKSPLLRGDLGGLIWRPAPSLPSGVYLVRASAGGRGDLDPDGPSTRGVIKSGSGTVATARVVYLK